MTLEKATHASNQHSLDLFKKVNNFNSLQSDVDRRLQILTRSETSDDAVGKFDSSMELLQRLEVATGYFQLLAEVDILT